MLVFFDCFKSFSKRQFSDKKTDMVPSKYQTIAVIFSCQKHFAMFQRFHYFFCSPENGRKRTNEWTIEFSGPICLQYLCSKHSYKIGRNEKWDEVHFSITSLHDVCPQSRHESELMNMGQSHLKVVLCCSYDSPDIRALKLDQEHFCTHTIISRGWTMTCWLIMVA